MQVGCDAHEAVAAGALDKTNAEAELQRARAENAASLPTLQSDPRYAGMRAEARAMQYAAEP